VDPYRSGYAFGQLAATLCCCIVVLAAIGGVIWWAIARSRNRQTATPQPPHPPYTQQPPGPPAPGETVRATQRVFHDELHPSRLILPVIPR
jgi:hypothetical protein